MASTQFSSADTDHETRMSVVSWAGISAMAFTPLRTTNPELPDGHSVVDIGHTPGCRGPIASPMSVCWPAPT